MTKYAVIAAVFLFIAYPVYAQDKGELREISKTIRAEEAELKKLQGEKAAVVRRLELISSKVSNYRKLLAAIDTGIKDTNRRLASVKAESKKTSADITKLKNDALGGNIFIIDNLGYANIKIIASANRQAETIAALEILSMATASLAERTDELNVQLERLKMLDEEERAGLAELKSLRTERTGAIKELAAEDKRYKDTLTVLKHDESGRREYLEMLEFRRKELDSQIKRSGFERGVSATENKAFERMRGKLPPAMRGRVIEGYGEQLVKEAGVTFFHKGVKIRPAKSSDVLSVAEGTVVFADFMKGFENLVVVSHGLPYYTVYGNMSYLGVSAGDKVSEGAVLGTIDVEAGYNNAYLYFEIRRNEQALDPGLWIAKDSKGVNR